MGFIEMARKPENVDSLNNLSNEELNTKRASLEIRRANLQTEIESVIEELKGISEEKFKRNTADK